MVEAAVFQGLSWNPVADVRELVSFPFMVHALEAGTIVAVMAGVTGWFMVLRRQTFAGHTLSMIAFPGAAAASLVGLPIMLGYFGFCGLGAVALAGIAGTRRSLGAESAAIGSLQALALALGFLFVSLYHGVLNGLDSLLFGTFLGITGRQVEVLLIVAVVTVALVAATWRPLFFASVDADVARAGGVPVRLCRGDEPDHRHPARLCAPRHPGRNRAPAHVTPRAGSRARGGDRARRHLARAGARLLLHLSGRVLRHVAFLRPLRARPSHPGGGGRPARLCARRGAGAGLMFAHEFMRNALIAGTFVGLACGLVGYFVVLRVQVFAGDALSHVAFTGAMAALVIGVEIRAGLYAATILGGIVLGLLGDRARADDVAIGSFFAWTLGLGALFLSIFTTRSSAGNGTGGVRILFGSIFGLSPTDVRVSVALTSVASILLLSIARPLLFASLDSAVAAARGVPIRGLGLGFLALVGLVAGQATQAVGALLLLGLLAAPAGAAHRLTANPFRGLTLSAALSVGSVWLGLTLSYTFPTLPPSSMIIASAVGVYVLAVAATQTPTTGHSPATPHARAMRKNEE
jgi:zinc/manganese transport system permease protein